MRHMNNLESVYTYEGTNEIHTLILGPGDHRPGGVFVSNTTTAGPPQPGHPTATITSADGLELGLWHLGGEGPPLLLAHATGFAGGLRASVAAHLTGQASCCSTSGPRPLPRHTRRHGVDPGRRGCHRRRGVHRRGHRSACRCGRTLGWVAPPCWLRAHADRSCSPQSGPTSRSSFRRSKSLTSLPASTCPTPRTTRGDRRPAPPGNVRRPCVSPHQLLHQGAAQRVLGGGHGGLPHLGVRPSSMPARTRRMVQSRCAAHRRWSPAPTSRDRGTRSGTRCPRSNTRSPWHWGVSRPSPHQASPATSPITSRAPCSNRTPTWATSPDAGARRHRRLDRRRRVAGMTATPQ